MATSARMMMKQNSLKIQTLSTAELTRLEQRLLDAAQLGLSLDAADIAVLQNILASYIHLQQKIQAQDATLAKLRKMCGFDVSSERNRNKKNNDPTCTDNAACSDHNAQSKDETGDNAKDHNNTRSVDTPQAQAFLPDLDSLSCRQYTIEPFAV